MSETLTVADHYRRHPGYSRFEQEHRGGGGYGLTFISSKQTAHDFTDPEVDELVVMLSLRSNMPFRWQIGDGWSDEHRFATGSMNVCPVATNIEYDCGGDHDVLLVACPRRRLEGLLYEYGQHSLEVFAPLHSQTVVHDGDVSSAILTMWRQSERNGDASAMMIDGLWQVIVARFLSRASVDVDVQGQFLTPTQIEQLEAFLTERLHDPINTNDLAQAMHMQPAHLSVSIRTTTGQTPHQYVLSRRIARAQELLAAGKMPLAEIAYACGFASQSHMTDVFREKLGVTPGRYRKEVRG